MKVWSLPSLQSVGNWEDLRRFSSQALTNFSQILTKNVSFEDNIQCQVKQDLEFLAGIATTISHDLNVIPIGFLVIKTNRAMEFLSDYSGWNNQQIVIQSDTDGTASIIILGS